MLCILGVGTVPMLYILNVGTVPTLYILNVGTVPMLCILNIGTVPTFSSSLLIFLIANLLISSFSEKEGVVQELEEGDQHQKCLYHQLEKLALSQKCQLEGMATLLTS